MPTASAGRPDRSSSSSKARLSKDDASALEDGDALADDTLVAEDDADLEADLEADAEDLDGSDDLDDDESEDDDLDDDDRATGSGATLTKTRRRTATAAGSTTTRTRPASKTREKSRRPKDQRTGNPFVALARFIREVVGEMRKVLWPSRRELAVYTLAVIVFVTVLIAIVGGLDFGFARLVLLVFG